MRILIATWDGAGGFQPQRTIVRALGARGHDVHVAAHESLQSRVESAGATFQRLPNIIAYDSRKRISSEEERAVVLDGIIFSEAFGSDVHAAALRLRPDVQLVDVALLTSAVAARAAGAPTGVLTTTIWKFVEWFGAQYHQRHAALDAFADCLGYRLPPTMMDLIGQAPVIASTYRPFEPDANFPPGYLAAGPLREAASVGAQPFTRMSPDKPLVLVSLSTGFMRQAATLITLCQAVANLQVEAVVTTGEAIDPQSLKVGANTRAFRFVPHDSILPMTRLVVSHAGHGTVMAALSHGVPLLLLPMGRDQPMVAARTVELGLGAIVDCNSSADAFAVAIERELGDPSKRSTCQTFMRTLEGHPGVDEALEAIERLGDIEVPPARG